MSEDERTPVNRPERPPEPEASDSLTRSLATRWGLAGAPPRAAHKGGPAVTPEPAAGGAYARLALTGVHTGFFLQRAQSKADGATVWRPDLGGLEPALVERFSEAIVGRQPELEVKYERRPLHGAASEVSELTLAGRATAIESGQEPATREGFRPFASLAEFRRALQTRESPADAAPDHPRPTAAPAPPLGPARPAAPALPSVRRRALSPGERRLSRVEEAPVSRPGLVEPPVTAPAPRAEESSAITRETGVEEPEVAGPRPAPATGSREREAVPPPPAGGGEPPSQALQRAPGPDRMGGGDLAGQDGLAQAGPPASGRVTEDLPTVPPGPEVAETRAQRPPREPVSPPSMPAVEGEPLEEALLPAQGTGAERAQARMSGQAPEVAGPGAEPEAAAEVAPGAQVQSAPPPSVQREGGQAGPLQTTGDSLGSLSRVSEDGQETPVAGWSLPTDLGPGLRRETTLPLAPLQRAPYREETPPAEMPPAETALVPDAGPAASARSPEDEATTALPEATPGEGEAGVEPAPSDQAAGAPLVLRRPGGVAPPPGAEPEREPAPRPVDAQTRPAEPATAKPSPASASVQAQPLAPAEALDGGEAGPAPVHETGAAMEPPLSTETQGELPARRLEETLVLPQLRRLARMARRDAEAEPGLGSVESYVPPGPLAVPASTPAAGGPGPEGEGAESASPGLLALASTVGPGTIQRSPVPGHEPVEHLPLPSPSLGAQAGNADLVQRAGVEPEEAGEGPDLDRLARDVLPLIKRMLAVERERRTGRWR
jgi:hypothetical protein